MLTNIRHIQVKSLYTYLHVEVSQYTNPLRYLIGHAANQFEDHSQTLPLYILLSVQTLMCYIGSHKILSNQTRDSSCDMIR
jgi:hypothetical protein